MTVWRVILKDPACLSRDNGCGMIWTGFDSSPLTDRESPRDGSVSEMIMQRHRDVRDLMVKLRDGKRRV
jgi:hypothetical protein